MLRLPWISSIGAILVQYSLASRSVSTLASTYHPIWQEGELTAKLWTWNSAVKDLADAGRELSRTSENLLVTCQTESTEAIRRFISKEWVLLAHGEHWGKTGVMSEKNAQILSVFARKPVDGSKLTVEASEAISSWTSPWLKVPGNPGNASRIAGGTVSKVLQADTFVHATDWKGKGGVSASLVLEATSQRPRSKLVFMCVHLDSDNDNVRTKGMVDMMLDLKTRSTELRSELEKESIDANGALKNPCVIWDSAESHCKSQGTPSSAEDPDSLTLLGDINYRLYSEGLEDLDQSELLSHEKRIALSRNDPLASDGSHPSQLVVPVKDGGLGFSCNRPYASYPPTYKRTGGGECKLLGEQLRTCGGAGQDICGEEAANLARRCYRKKDKKGTVSWSTKGDKLQLGWLDRFCSRTIPPTKLSTHMTDEEGWSATPGVKDKTGSDHMPVSVTLRLVSDSMCPCPVLPNLQTLSKCSSASITELGMGATDTLGCSAGYSLVDTTARTQARLFDLEVRCGTDRRLAACSGDGTKCKPLSLFQCVRSCGKYSGSVTARTYPGVSFIPPSSPVSALLGESIRLSCPDGMVFVGNDEMICSSTGSYVSPAGDELQPICLATCDLSAAEAVGRLYLKERAVAGPGLLQGPYGHMIRQYFPAQEREKKMFVGGHLKMRCRAQCLPLGDGILTCADDAMLQPALKSVKCACGLKVQVRSVSISDEQLEKEMTYLKIQVFRGPIRSADDLAQARSTKAYVASAKYRRDKQVSLIIKDRVEGTELHLTLCRTSKNPFGFKKNMLSNCLILGETNSEHGLQVSKILERVTDWNTETELRIPVLSDGKQVDVSLKVSLEASGGTTF